MVKIKIKYFILDFLIFPKKQKKLIKNIKIKKNNKKKNKNNNQILIAQKQFKIFTDIIITKSNVSDVKKKDIRNRIVINQKMFLVFIAQDLTNFMNVIKNFVEDVVRKGMSNKNVKLRVILV